MGEERLPAFEREPYRTSLATTVIEAGVDAGKPFAVLEDTILYPEGGGQPPDRGTLNGVAVLDVQKKDGAIRHVLAAPVPPGPADLRLDWERRFDHMQQHTGQHLLSAVAQDRFRWETTAFHLGPEVSDVELAVASLSAADLARLEEAVAAEIRAARPVVPRRVSLEEFRALPVRTRGLPEGFSGDVRLVEIAGVDLNTCGGTHLSNTAEIEVVALLSNESLRGGTRVFFAAGGRARRRLKRHEDRNAALRVALGAADEALVDAARTKLEQLSEAQKALRRAEESLAAAAAEALLTRDGRVARVHFEGRDMAFVQAVARRFAEKAGARIALVTATAGGQHVFALGAGEGFGDAQALGREVAALLGGKGGGSGRVFQGKAAGLEGVDRAAARLAAT
ncbi:MAG: alanyl-tRNA editing protein [Acidobacteria bacterium]|nr:alanyl-tRNA editing protein [Acidobacteriota bacterium]